MHRSFFFCLIFALFAAGCTNPAPETSTAAPSTEAATSDIPEEILRWENDIAAFEAEDQATAPPEDALVFIGSSSIRLWSTLKDDMAPMPVIQRGFGGSKLGDAIHYMDRIITPYAPRAIVIFSGSNDIAGDNPKPAEEVLALYKEFVAGVDKAIPGTPIYFIAISPTMARWQHRDIVAAANQQIEAFSAEHAHLHFIDTASALLDDEGNSKTELFREDQLHLNADGYAVWTSIIKPALTGLY